MAGINMRGAASSSRRVELFQESNKLYNEGKLDECVAVSFRTLELAREEEDQQMMMGIHSVYRSTII